MGKQQNWVDDVIRRAEEAAVIVLMGQRIPIPTKSRVATQKLRGSGLALNFVVTCKVNSMQRSRGSFKTTSS